MSTPPPSLTPDERRVLDVIYGWSYGKRMPHFPKGFANGRELRDCAEPVSPVPDYILEAELADISHARFRVAVQLLIDRPLIQVSAKPVDKYGSWDLPDLPDLANGRVLTVDKSVSDQRPGYYVIVRRIGLVPLLPVYWQKIDDPIPFANECYTLTPEGLRVAEVDQPTTPKRKRGRPLETDPNKDRRIYEAWQSPSHETYADLANAKGWSEPEVSKAIDRHRKRLAQQQRKH